MTRSIYQILTMLAALLFLLMFCAHILHTYMHDGPMTYPLFFFWAEVSFGENRFICIYSFCICFLSPPSNWFVWWIAHNCLGDSFIYVNAQDGCWYILYVDWYIFAQQFVLVLEFDWLWGLFRHAIFYQHFFFPEILKPTINLQYTVVVSLFSIRSCLGENVVV